MSPGDDGPTWRIRRRFLIIVNAFCMFTILYVLIKGLDTAPAEAAVTMAFVTITGSVGSYVFGATWQDISSNK